MGWAGMGWGVPGGNGMGMPGGYPPWAVPGMPGGQPGVPNPYAYGYGQYGQQPGGGGGGGGQGPGSPPLPQYGQQQMPPPPPPLGHGGNGGGQPPLPPPAPATQLGHAWTEHTTPEGLKYYYNTSTGTSSWDRPPELGHQMASGMPQAVPPLPPLPNAGNAASATVTPATSSPGGNNAGAASGLEDAMGALSCGGNAASYGSAQPVSGPMGSVPTSGSAYNGLGLPALSGLGSMASGTNGSSGGADALGDVRLSGGATPLAGEQSSVVISEWPGGQQELRQAFSRFGTITFCETDSGSGSARVTFDAGRSATTAVDMMNGIAVGDKKLHVSLSY